RGRSPARAHAGAALRVQHGYPYRRVRHGSERLQQLHYGPFAMGPESRQLQVLAVPAVRGRRIRLAGRAVRAGGVRRGRGSLRALARRVADQSSHMRGRSVRGLKRAFARAFARRPDDCRLALAEARAYLGLLLARTWQMTPATDFAFPRAVALMLAADHHLGGRNGPLIRGSFARRLIEPRSAA